MHRSKLTREIFKASFVGAVGAAVGILFGHSFNLLPLTKKPLKAAELVQNPPIPYTDPRLAEYSVAKVVGLPSSSHLRVFDGFICAYDRRNRIPLWVMEHLTPEKLSSAGNPNVDTVDRAQFDFYEDLGELEMFRSSSQDYKRSGYDRGHMAAAGNHRFHQSAMAQTFILSNIAPQVGKGFNRDAWNDLEKYVRKIARNSRNVVVVTGPLFLPEQYGDRKRVSYEVIGNNNVAVPTHFFKAIAIQDHALGTWRSVAWVMPNNRLPEKVNLDYFQVPLSTVERASGLQIFPKL